MQFEQSGHSGQSDQSEQSEQIEQSGQSNKKTTLVFTINMELCLLMTQIEITYRSGSQSMHNFRFFSCWGQN